MPGVLIIYCYDKVSHRSNLWEAGWLWLTVQRIQVYYNGQAGWQLNPRSLELAVVGHIIEDQRSQVEFGIVYHP